MMLDIYFARRFILSFLLITSVFLALMMLIDLLEQLRKFEGTDVSTAQISWLMMLNVPGAISQILPLIMILSSVILFVGLARSSELVVTRAAGRSGIRSLAAPVVVTIVIGLLAVSTLNPIVAASSNRYQQLADTYRTGRTAALSISGEGLWLRQGGDSGQSVIHAQGYDPTTATLFDVTMLTYDTGNGPVRRISAESAQLDDGAWRLKKVKLWPLESDVNPESSASYHDAISVETSLTRERIQNTLGRPSGVSIYDMLPTIQQLAAAGFATRRYEVWYQSELARPLFLVAMVLVGAAFTMRHTRLGGTGGAVLTSVLLGFGLYFIRNFARVLGENGQLPVELAAWAPPVAAILLALGLLLHAEDG
ncbi:MAG: LPS export ABC transporter permease LptG [Paracoccaceae bacterium]